MSVLRIPFSTIMLAVIFGAMAPAKAQDAAFAAADRNHDGALDKAEFRTFIDELAGAGRPNAVKIKSAGRYDTAFGRLDKNGDGRVTSDEISPSQ